jgi:S-adenosylmethionine hydrolase
MIITLTTDFGLRDAYAGVMKGVILSLAPAVRIVDLTHEIPAQDILAGALALEEACPYFPPGTIHLAVIDPGVGSERLPLALETERAFYVGPDNGVFDLVIKKEGFKRAVKLDNPQYWIGSLIRGAAVSRTFHGRDIFAPAAAYLAHGTPFENLGSPAAVSPKLSVSHPIAQGERLTIHVVRVDHFGNLITDLTPHVFKTWNPENEPVAFTLTHGRIAGICATFADVPEGSPVAYFGSSGRLEMAIRGGNAALCFKVLRGNSIAVERM